MADEAMESYLYSAYAPYSYRYQLPPLRPREQEQGSSATASGRPGRFPRTIAVYSPMASRRLTTFLEEPGQEEEAEAEEEEEAAAAEDDEQQRAEAAAVRASWEQPPASSAEPRPPQQQQQQQEADEEAEAAPPQAASEEASEPQGAPEGQPQAAAPQEQGKTRLRFQFLEQKYGYYHCKDCNIRWESAYVWCVQGTNKVYFRQFCRTCQKSYNPYRVEDITCQKKLGSQRSRAGNTTPTGDALYFRSTK